MFCLVTYDVATAGADGRKRLRQVANICENYGVRVQHSVFECTLRPAQFEWMKAALCEAIDEKEDGVRIYVLRESALEHVVTLGVSRSFLPERDAVIF